MIIQQLLKRKEKSPPVLDLRNLNPPFHLEKEVLGSENLMEPLLKGDEMNHRKVLDSALAAITERGESYGPIYESFDRVAKISTIMLGKEITSYDASIIMMAVKMSRLAYDRTHEDSWIDLAAYTSFAGDMSVPERDRKPDFVDGFAKNVDSLVTRLRAEQSA